MRVGVGVVGVGWEEGVAGWGWSGLGQLVLCWRQWWWMNSAGVPLAVRRCLFSLVCPARPRSELRPDLIRPYARELTAQVGPLTVRTTGA